MQHITAVCGVCDFQAPAETGIGRHFIIYYAGGFLRQQDDVDTERPANREDPVHHLHKIWEPQFKLGEFVNNKEQVRKRFCGLAFTKQVEICGNIAHLIPIQQGFAAGQLILQSNQVSTNTTVKVRNTASQVREVFERQQQSRSLKVYQDKGY